MKIRPSIWERRKNGTFDLEGLSWDRSKPVSFDKKPCQVCFELGHDDHSLELFQTKKGLFWICNCFDDMDCGPFAFPAEGFTEKDIRDLTEERKRYLKDKIRR